jgi:glycosyltransferase involved in cell wall biosynthesis
MQLAVIIPAYNEEKTIGNVVNEYRKALPEAAIYVGDNNSSDRTAELALKAGAVVIPCERQGKGNAVRKMFDEIEADIFVMIDADETYSAANVRDLIKPVAEGKAEMVVGARKQISENAFSFSHKIGNFVLTNILNRFFKVNLKDILSGYRVMSRKMVEELILLADGFEIEAEVTIRALQDKFRIIEIPIEYRNRPAGSESKLSTWGDGLLILYTILTLFRDYNPMVFFVLLSMFFLGVGLVSGTYILIVYLQTGLMYHTGLAVLTALSILLSVIIFIMGLLLDSFNNSWRLSQETMRRNRILMKKLINEK